VEKSINIEDVGFCIAKSEMDPNTFFIFRDNGIEVKIKYENGSLKRSQALTRKELSYLRINKI